MQWSRVMLGRCERATDEGKERERKQWEGTLEA